MLTSNGVYFLNEKLEFSRNYNGELCDVMAFYEKNRFIIIYSYLVAIFLKIYNMYFTSYLEIHVEAKQKDVKVADIIRLHYFKFFTETLPDSENTLSFFGWNKPFYAHILTANYFLIIALCIMIGTD